MRDRCSLVLGGFVSPTDLGYTKQVNNEKPKKNRSLEPEKMALFACLSVCLSVPSECDKAGNACQVVVLDLLVRKSLCSTRRALASATYYFGTQ